MAYGLNVSSCNPLNFGNKLFWFVSSDLCHKKILRKSLNIPLNNTAVVVQTQGYVYVKDLEKMQKNHLYCIFS